MSQYTHTTKMHNLVSPSEIVPVIMQLVNPQSVVDVGCGLGTFLHVFKKNGVQTILGVDGPWCKKELLFENITSAEFVEVNMEETIGVDRRFDLAVCLEVAEHLSPDRGPSFARDLTSLADVVLFSAAIPKQGGDHHLNEQWVSYWAGHFASQGYELFDVLKPFFWTNEKVFSWYKQNMVLFVKKGVHIPEIEVLPKNTLTNAIHPDLFQIVVDIKDPNAVKRYARGLIKSVGYKLGLVK